MRGNTPKYMWLGSWVIMSFTLYLTRAFCKLHPNQKQGENFFPKRKVSLLRIQVIPLVLAHQPLGYSPLRLCHKSELLHFVFEANGNLGVSETSSLLPGVFLPQVCFSAVPTVSGSFWARDRIGATTVTYATAVATLDPSPMWELLELGFRKRS